MPNRNPSPKSRFLESADNLKRHHAMIETREFERACDVALAEYQRAMAQGPNNDTPNGAQLAMAAHYKQMGAVEFVHILKNLADVPERPSTRVSEQLDHKA